MVRERDGMPVKAERGERLCTGRRCRDTVI